MRSGFGFHTMHHFELPKLHLFFLNELAQSTSLGPKLSFWVVSHDSVMGSYLLGPKLSFWVVSSDSVAGRYPLLDRVWGAYNAPL